MLMHKDIMYFGYVLHKIIVTLLVIMMRRMTLSPKSYGVRMADGPLAGLLARAVVVIGKDGKIAYTELVPEITQEPDYDKALAAVK